MNPLASTKTYWSNLKVNNKKTPPSRHGFIKIGALLSTTITFLLTNVLY